MNAKSKIYTKAGDRGQTSLIGGRTKKSDSRVEAYGSVDELNATLGLVRSFNQNKEIDQLLLKIQNELFNIGTELSSIGKLKKDNKIYFLQEEKIEELEKEIDEFDGSLPEIANFILPSGTQTSSLLHLARTVCRRAERRVVALAETSEINPAIIKYLNRLSDLLFVLARSANNGKDILWKQ